MFNPRYILHIADLHIGSGLRSVEYRKVFDNLFMAIETHPGREQMMVVIAGDIFHHKTRYSGEDIEDFNYLMNGLKKRPIIIIPGNHDANLNAKERTDLISPLITPNIHYWKQSGRYNLHGIDFYHISVFDDSTVTEIDTMAPTLQNTIVLYHGMINEAKFGSFTAKDTRISSNIVTSCRLLIAGDIHQHQFIATNAAYSGSLIQQNSSESTTKGVVIWDLTNNTGRFIQIENNSGFIRMDLRGKSKAVVERELANLVIPNDILKVSIITDVGDLDIDEQIAAIKNKTGQVDRVNRCFQQTISPSSDITETLGEILLAAGATEDQFDEIVTMHAGKIGSYECKKWHVGAMQWDNMFRYGKGNSIDFTKLAGGISGVIAPNCAGKSSIIDILVFGLFGEHIRGDKKSMINVDAKDSRIRVDFMVNDKKYYVERKDDSGKHTKIILCREDGNIHDQTQWTNITEIAVDSTYRKIKQMIGSLDQFYATGLYYDSINDIIKMSKSDRMKLLPELFGLVDNEIILKDIKAKMKLAKDKIAILVKPRMEDPQAELDSLKGRLESTADTRIITAKSLEDTNKSIDETKNKLLGLRSRSHVAKELAQTISSAESMINKLDNIHVETEVKFAEPIHLKPDELKMLRQLVTTITEPSNDLSVKIAVIKSTGAQKYLSVDIVSLMGLKAKLEQTRNTINVKNTQVERMQIENTEEIQKEVAILEKASAIKIPTVNTEYLTSLRNRRNKLADESTLKFNPDCTNCGENKICLNKELATVEEELKIAEIDATKIKADIVKKTEQLRCINERRTVQTLALNQIIANNTQVTRLLQLENEISDLDKKITAYNLNHDNIEQLKILERQLVVARNKELAAEKLNKLYQYEQYVQCTTRDKLQLDILSCGRSRIALEAELKTIDDHFIDHEYLEVLLQRKLTFESELSTADKLLGSTVAVINTVKKELEIKTNYDLQFPQLTADYAKYKLYADAIGSTGLRIAIIRRNIDRVMLYTNNILSSVANFAIKCEITDSTIDIYLVENETSRPIALASGFQKFVISISLRMALINVLPSSSDFIMIDEGFGCMDALNTHKLADLFTSIAASNKFTFIISHIDELTNLINLPLFIQHTGKSGQTSFISNRIDTTNPLSAGSELAEVKLIDDVTAWKEAREAIVIGSNNIMCPCGSLVARRSIITHNKTLKHKKYLETQK